MIDKTMLELGENGNVDAMLKLGDYYFNANDENRDYNLAFKWYTHALEADPDSIVACKKVGFCYENGVGVGEDEFKAFELYQRFSQKGYDDATYILACAYRFGMGTPINAPRAIELFSSLAIKGDTASMVMLGKIYAEGVGIDKNYAIAVSCFEQAANRDDRSGLYELAMCYLNGYGVPTDDVRAFELLLKAAEFGDVTSQLKIGLCYEHGTGVQRDIDKAMNWYKRAADHGSGIAAFNYSQLVLSSESLSAEQAEEVITYLDKSVSEGFYGAYHTLGLIYHDGKIVEKDIEKTIEYWTKGAKSGDANCSRCLAIMYQDGDGVEKNLDASLEWYNKAIGQGDHIAAGILGEAYYNGNDGLEQSFSKAMHYCQKAFELGDSIATYYIGAMYDNGYGVETDFSKAFEYYKAGAEMGNAQCKVLTAIFMFDEKGGAEKDIPVIFDLLEQALDLGHEQVGELIMSMFPLVNDPNKIGVERYCSINTKLAEAGNAQAQFYLYRIYADGIGVEPDSEKADYWIKKSADNGNADAQAVYGFKCYIQNDISEAVKYWELSVHNGAIKPMSDLAAIYMFGTQGYPVDKVRALELYTKAAAAGDVHSQYTLGLLYSQGTDVEQDFDKAISWLNKAAQNGSVEALKILGNVYYKLDDIRGAVHAYSQAADEGDSEAKYMLGLLYNEIGKEQESLRIYNDLLKGKKDEFYYKAKVELGTYSAKNDDLDTAFVYWKDSANNGNSDAQYKLSLMYESGKGVSRDMDLARYWLNEAAARGNKLAIEKMNRRPLSDNGYNYGDNSYSAQKSGGCYIATAVYGSYDCSEVWTLRRYRDYYLAESRWGRCFIRVYYAISPVLVKIFGNSKVFRRFWKKHLDKMVARLQYKGYENTPYKDRKW